MWTVIKCNRVAGLIHTIGRMISKVGSPHAAGSTSNIVTMSDCIIVMCYKCTCMYMCIHVHW